MFALYGLQARDEALTVELWQSMLHPEDRRNNELTFQKALAHRDDYDNVFRIIWGDGSIHHIRAAGKVSRNEQGAPVRMTGTSIDITESERLKAEIAEQHELLTVTLASIGDGVITTDADGDVTWMNPVAEQMTGWSVSESVGQQIDQVFNIVDEETRTRAENPLHACMSGSRTVGLANNTVLTSRIGIEYGIADSAAPIHNSKNELLGMVLVFHDVTEQRRLTGEMSYRASHDALTGLINRIEFDSRLRRMLKKAQADGTSGALLYIDLDQFKIVNDTCGHAVGDQLLQQVAKLLCGVIRTTDTLARLGGDEFAVLLEDCTNVQAGRLAQRICESIGNFRFIHDGQRFRIGASIGLVHVDDRWSSVSAIQQAADSSCYAAKEAGRNRVHLWYDTDESILSRKTQMKWTTRLESALDENRFVLFFQRIEPLNGRPTGVHAEILLRMVDSDGSLVSPGAFMPAAERFHLASRIDRLVLRKAINWMTQTPALGAIDTLSINFSGQSVGDRSFHQWALNELETAGLDICRKLCIEITETAAVTNFADASTFIEQVHLRGVRVALDDFGAGAASFGYLKTLSVDIIKIDGQFIRNLATDPLDAAAVRCFVDVARVMGLKTVAEFVEDPTVRDLLRDMNVDFGQGFLLHRPESLDLFVDSG
jgi:diguanylate cyclase (GGDEF)-like protein/PAS domain S-box-containing protein